MASSEKMYCSCNHVEMVPLEVTFSYLGREFRHPVLRCPACGQVYIPEELAKGRMAEVESALEEK